MSGYCREVAADRIDSEITIALALLQGHMKLAGGLVDMLALLETPSEQLAWARAELDQLQATVRDLSIRYRP